jgi:RimJ/RimL family protein N-acetyltransferase
MPAVMGSRQRLWQMYGKAWGWPPATMTTEQDREDLQHHEREMVERLSYNYALFDDAETELIGCVYIEPPLKAGADAEVSWWVRDEYVGTGVEDQLDRLVPGWLASAWPFTAVRYVGRDLSWDEWLALPDREPSD